MLELFKKYLYKPIYGISLIIISSILFSLCLGNTFAAVFEKEYFMEKLETKAGWNRPSCDEDWFRGFSQEINDFIQAIREDRDPYSGIDLAVDCVNVIYSAYLSSEEGRVVSLD